MNEKQPKKRQQRGFRRKKDETPPLSLFARQIEKKKISEATQDSLDHAPEANIKAYLKRAFSELVIEKIDLTTKASAQEALHTLHSKSEKIETLLRQIRVMKNTLPT